MTHTKDNTCCKECIKCSDYPNGKHIYCHDKNCKCHTPLGTSDEELVDSFEEKWHNEWCDKTETMDITDVKDFFRTAIKIARADERERERERIVHESVVETFKGGRFPIEYGGKEYAVVDLKTLTNKEGDNNEDV